MKQQTKDYVLYEPAAQLYISENGLVKDIKNAKLYTQAEAGDLVNFLRKQRQYFEIKTKEKK